MSSQDRYLMLAVLSVLAMIVLIYSVKISPAQDNNPFSGATSIWR